MAVGARTAARGERKAERGVRKADRGERIADRELEGVIREQLPSGLYHVEIDGPHRITAHVGGGLEKNFVRLLVGDRVLVELTPRDRSRGRVVRKL